MTFNLSNLQESAKSFFQTATEKVDEVAEKVAEKCTEWTGRETTSSEVKKVALIAGVAAVSVAALGAVADVASVAEFGAESVADDGGFGGDWQGQATRFFAENGGSLNFETPYVDCEGQVYS